MPQNETPKKPTGAPSGADHYKWKGGVDALRYRDPDKRREYMRNYMRDRYRRLKQEAAT